MFLILYQHRKNVRSGKFPLFLLYLQQFLSVKSVIFYQIKEQTKQSPQKYKSTIEKKEEFITMKITDTIKSNTLMNHRVSDLFEGQYKVPNGMSYNSY